VSRCSQAYMPHTKKDVKGFWLESLAERVWSGVQKRHLVKGVFERNNKIFEISEGVEEQDGAPVDPQVVWVREDLVGRIQQVMLDCRSNPPSASWWLPSRARFWFLANRM